MYFQSEYVNWRYAGAITNRKAEAICGTFNKANVLNNQET